MAVVNVKTIQVTNADASQQALNKLKTVAARIKEAVGTVEVTNGDSIGSTYRMHRVHSSWRISQILKLSDVIATAVADFGLYDIAALGGAVVDADFFASAVALTAADVVGTDVTHEAAGAGNQFGEIANVEKTIWEALGLAADPNKYYDLVATLTAAATGTGTLSVKTRFTDGN